MSGLPAAPALPALQRPEGFKGADSAMFEHCLSIPVFSASPRDVRTFKDYVLCVPNSLFSAPMFFKLVLAGVALGGVFPRLSTKVYVFGSKSRLYLLRSKVVRPRLPRGLHVENSGLLLPANVRVVTWQPTRNSSPRTWVYF